jgi:hypothetical protein
VQAAAEDGKEGDPATPRVSQHERQVGTKPALWSVAQQRQVQKAVEPEEALQAVLGSERGVPAEAWAQAKTRGYRQEAEPYPRRGPGEVWMEGDLWCEIRKPGHLQQGQRGHH